MPDSDTILDLAHAIRTGRHSARAAVDHHLTGIESLDARLNCFRETWPDAARAAADAIDTRRTTEDPIGDLAGVPLAVKDNIATLEGTTAAGSRMLDGYRSPFDATVVERLRAAGAVMVGKVQCDEFAMGSSTEHCAFGPTRNPWAPDRVPGGSSGGSAAAVAAGLCAAALGSDTGGSIRQPAALCGIVGVKPSYGRVSRYGLVAFGSSLDQIGTLTRTVHDGAALLAAMAGPDARDSTSADVPVPEYVAQLDDPIRGLRIGMPRQHMDDRNHPDVNRTVREAVEYFRTAGAEIVDIDLPLMKYGIATYYVIAPAEASSNLARYDGVRYGHRATLPRDASLDDLYARSRAEGFGPEVQRRIMLGTYVLSSGYYDAYYLRALRVRRLIYEEYERAFEQCHAIIGPTTPAPAFRIGEKADPLTMYLSDVYTINANIAGLCAISVPGGFAEVDGTRLPVGIQFQCRAFDEQTMFRVARQFERDAPYERGTPEITIAS